MSIDLLRDERRRRGGPAHTARAPPVTLWLFATPPRPILPFTPPPGPCMGFSPLAHCLKSLYNLLPPFGWDMDNKLEAGQKPLVDGLRPIGPRSPQGSRPCQREVARHSRVGGIVSRPPHEDQSPRRLRRPPFGKGARLWVISIHQRFLASSIFVSGTIYQVEYI